MVTSHLKTLHPTHPPPPHSGLSGALQGLSPHNLYTSFWSPGRQGICLKSVFACPTGSFAGLLKINLFISWLPTVVLQSEYHVFESRGGRMHHSFEGKKRKSYPALPRKSSLIINSNIMLQSTEFIGKLALHSQKTTEITPLSK